MRVEPPQFGPDHGPRVQERPPKRGAHVASEQSWEAVSQVDSSATALLTLQTRGQLAEMVQQQQQSQQVLMQAMQQLAARMEQLEVRNQPATPQNRQIGTPKEQPEQPQATTKETAPDAA